MVVVTAVSNGQLRLILVLLLLLLAHRVDYSIGHSAKLAFLVAATLRLLMERGASQLLLFEVGHGSGVGLSAIPDVHALFLRRHDDLEDWLILILLGLDRNRAQEAFACIHVRAVRLLDQDVRLLESLVTLWAAGFVHVQHQGASRLHAVIYFPLRTADLQIVRILLSRLGTHALQIKV